MTSNKQKRDARRNKLMEDVVYNNDADWTMWSLFIKFILIMGLVFSEVHHYLVAIKAQNLVVLFIALFIFIFQNDYQNAPNKGQNIEKQRS